MSSIAKNKKLARQHWRSLPIPPSDWVVSASQSIVEKIVSSPEFKAAGQVSSFSALPWEPNLFGVWKAAPQKVVYPRIDYGRDRIDFFFLTRLEELTPNRHQILEPPVDHPARTWKAGDIILVPALAFDRNLNRLGSGKGYYDRFLDRIPHGVLRWGVVFKSRISPTALPVEDFDQKVDRIISDE